MDCVDSLLCPLPLSKPRTLTGRPRFVAFALLMAKRPLQLCASTLASNCSIPVTDQEDFPLSKGRRTWDNILWLQVLKGFHWKGSPSKKRKTAVAVGFFFLTKKMLRNRWNRCKSLSEALPVLRCWGLLQIFKFQGVPKSFQVSMTRDSPEGHVVLEWNQKSGIFFLFLYNTDIKTTFLVCPLRNRVLYLATRLSQCQRQGGRKKQSGKCLFVDLSLLHRQEDTSSTI